MLSEAAWFDIVTIQDLVSRERYWRDREDWDAMRSAYTDDAQIRVTWFEGSIDDYIEGSRNPSWDAASWSKHRLSPSVVTVDGDRALAETSALVELRVEFNDTLIDLIISVRLLSRIARTPRGWKLASMDAIYEKDVVTPVYPADRLAISAVDTAPYRRSYQFLAYGGQGQLPEDIPGDDKPELVDALYDAAHKWLRA
ncbi:nuclear transport factor 2 family protein [Nocardia sp. NBC_01499]|uniref:nuclear transport factor 2 family protein n=1 Tax=Nocardia sp. NBC_01499 TaxID=2903597 RepID=UPI003865AD85